MWEKVRLRNVCSVRRGTTITKNDTTEGVIPVVGGGTKATYSHNAPNREAGAITISGSGANAGYVNYWVEPIFASDCSTVEAVSDDQEQRFIYYFLLSQQEYIFKYLRSGAAQPHVYAKDIAELKLPLVPLTEQQRIVAILDEAFEGIDAAIANTQANLASARELFESYLNRVFTKKGEGWVEKTIGEVCTLKSGTTVKAELEKAVGDVPYVKVADMNLDENREGVTTSSRFLDNDNIGKNAIFPIGTTIFPKRGGAILTNKKRITRVPICADLNTMGVVPGKSVTAHFLYFYFLSVDMRVLGSGATIPQINNYDIAPLKFSYPPTEQQERLVMKLADVKESSNNLKTIYQRKLDALNELKQSILAKAFRGELTNTELAA